VKTSSTRVPASSAAAAAACLLPDGHWRDILSATWRIGTASGRAAIEARLRAGEDVVLEIDFQGALQIKRLFAQAVLIFILPPSWEELRQRLQRRGEDSPEVIEQRMANARVEVAQARQFDYIVVNALFETALFDLKTIVHAQRLKYLAQRRSRPAVFGALQLN